MKKKIKKVAKPVYLSMDAKIKKFQSELKRLKKQYKNEDTDYSSSALDAMDDVIVSFKSIFAAKKKKKDD